MNIDINGLGSNRADGPKKQSGSKATESAPKTDNSNVTSIDSSSKDSVSLSSSAQNLARIEAELKALPEVNQARVDEVRAKIERGEYTPDSDNLARKMLEMG